MAMIFTELKAEVPLIWVEGELMDGEVLAKDLVPCSGKISWEFLERHVTDAKLYDGLLHNSFADGRNGLNLWPG